jgi:hypothetical protein
LSLIVYQYSSFPLLVAGIQALDLTVSSSGVWALNTNGEIMFRYGIAQGNVSGDYWKKIPGCFTKLSGSLIVLF